MKIYTSNDNSILIDKITSELIEKANLNPNENFCLIVPEKFSVSMEGKLLEKSKGGAIMNIQVITLSRLLHRLIASSDNYLSKVLGIMATKKIIIENYDNLVCYKKTAKTMGFAENIYDTISELKNSNVTPEDYYTKNKTGTSLDIKLHDIFLLYNAYEKFLKKEKLVDPADRFNLLSDKIYESDYVKSSHIYVYGFDSTTATGLNVFNALLNTAKSFTCACLDNSNKGNSYICPPEMLENYLLLASKNKIKPVVVNTIGSKITLGSHISNNLFAYPYSRLKINGGVVLYGAKSVLEELEMIASCIRERVIKYNLRYRDFAVICASLDGVSDLLKMVFNDYKLPYFIDAPSKLSDQPLCGFLESAINVYRKNFNSDDFLSLASNIFSGVTTSEYASLENYVVKYAINYNDFLKPFEYKANSDDELAEINKTREKIAGKIQRAFNGASKCAKAKDFNLCIKALFTEFGIDEKIGSIEQELDSLGRLDIKEATKQVHKKINELMDGAEKIFGDTEISLDEYFAVLDSGLNSETISLIPITVDNIFVGEATSAKLFNKKVLIVVGAVDGAFPAIKDDCGIIVDKELEMISSTIGKKIEPTIKTINKREKFKVINLLSNFSNELIVSFSSFSRTGDEQRPSSVIRELSKIFIQENSGKNIEVLNAEWFSRVRNIISEKDRIVSYAFDFSTPTVGMKKYLSATKRLRTLGSISNENMYGDLKQALIMLNNPVYNSQLNEINNNSKAEEITNARSLYFKDNKTSISQLETYFACPFKFFASYGLRLKPRDEAYLKSVDYGNILHKIAENYMKNIERFEAQEGLPYETRAKNIEKIITKVFNEEKLKTANNKHMVLQLKKEAYRLIDALTFQYRRSAFKPIAEEISFGANGNSKGVDVGENISLEGKIDRVDKYKNYFRVIDYKTGHIDLASKTTYYGEKIQLFSYLLATKNEKLKPAGAFYLPIRNVFIDENEGTNFSTYKMQGYFVNDPEIIKAFDEKIAFENNKSDVVNVTISTSKENKETGTITATGSNALTSDELEGLIDYTKKIATGATKEILSGYIKPSPLESDGRTPCDYCDYKYACGRDFNSNLEVRKSRANITLENFIDKGKNDDR